MLSRPICITYEALTASLPAFLVSLIGGDYKGVSLSRTIMQLATKDFSVGFSHPAVPASNNNPEKLIPVAVKDIDGYSPFFSFNDGHPSTSSS